MRVLTGKHGCGRLAKLLAINQRGPAGPPGPTGAAGSGGSYSAGTGLTLSGNTFGADFSELQARISGSGCASDQALQSVSQSGSPSCATLHAYAAPPGTAAVGLQNLTSVAVPAGTWIVLGQASANDGDTVEIDFTCELESRSTQFDEIYQSVAAGYNATLSPSGTTTTTGPSTVVTLLCTSSSSHTTIGSMSLIAIPAAALN